MKLVSIIIPVYNGEEQVRYCYKSLINQTYKNIEIIFVDDGSTDNTLNVLKSFTDDRVVILKEKNSGPSFARRNGFNNSHGEYICFVDCDDMLAPSYIDKMVKAIEYNHTDIAISTTRYHFSNPKIARPLTIRMKTRPKVINLNNSPEYLPVLTPFVWGKIFKRNIIDLPAIDLKANEDLVIMYPLYAKVGKIAVNNSAIYHYYHSKNSQKYLLFDYKFESIYKTFKPLEMVYNQFKEMGKLNKYYYSLEMLFIKNIFERIENVANAISDKRYLNQFIDIILEYLEFFFPNWQENPYYQKGFELGEFYEIIRIQRINLTIKKIKRNQTSLSLDEIYKKYQLLEEEYEKKDYISRI